MRRIATLALIVAATWDVQAGTEVPTVVARAGWPIVRAVMACPTAESRAIELSGMPLTERVLSRECLATIRSDEDFYIYDNGVLQIITEHVTVAAAALVEAAQGPAMLKIEMVPYDEGPLGGMAGAIYVYYFVAEDRPAAFTLRQRESLSAPPPPLPSWARPRT